MKKLRISILMDNPKSWFVPYGKRLSEELQGRGHDADVIHDPNDLREGDIAFFLSSEHIIGNEFRARNTHNIVVHGSALPKGKGWSPLTWQILEGTDEIPITLFEAGDKVDDGAVYDTASVRFEGHELIDELRDAEARAIFDLALAFVDRYPNISGMPQSGEESFYPKRTPEDSRLDTEKSIAEQFELLRVADNERYPAFFEHRGHRYTLKIYKDSKNKDG